MRRLPLVLAIVLACSRAWAAGVRVEGPEDAFTQRLRAEISALGHEVLAVDSKELTRARLDVKQRSVELWIDGELVEVISRSTWGTGEDDALRIAERVRTALAPPPAPPPPRVVVKSEKVVVMLTKPPRARVIGVSVGAGPFLSSGVGASLVVTAYWRAPYQIRVGVLGGIPLVGTEITSSEGSARVEPLFVGPLVEIGFLPSDWRVEGHVGACIAGAWVRTSATARPPYGTTDSSAITAVPQASLRFDVRIVPNLSVGMLQLLGASLPPIDVVFAGKTVGGWGRGISITTLGATLEI